ncbi:response regulator [Trinickia violacea]|uniref:Response regulator n=1 Tax=Trinickia violacea TaxID=2571746 RepID=A0A4P8IMU1_9BURK|nr:response regulator [Trinickia violacea]QCP49147.1 response regulator [Trinickia violacea]
MTQHESSGQSVSIILIEDDDGHATLIQRNLRRAGLTNGFIRLTDGQEAIDYFFGDDARFEHDALSAPVILLDLKMPRIDGLEVLRRLKTDPRTASLPVIMLTTTDDPREIERCYELGCNVYVTKPVESEAFIEAVRRLGFFLQVVKLPTGGR